MITYCNKGTISIPFFSLNSRYGKRFFQQLVDVHFAQILNFYLAPGLEYFGHVIGQIRVNRLDKL